MSEAIRDLVQRHAFLDGLPERAVDLVAEHAVAGTYRPGDVLFREGEPADLMFLLTQGHVAIEIHAPNRGPIVVETLAPGHIVGLSWAAPPFRYGFDARAIDEVEGVEVDSAHLRAALAADPGVGFPFLERLSAVILERLQATRVRLLDLYGSVGAH